jgi:hypothetical protein
MNGARCCSPHPRTPQRRAGEGGDAIPVGRELCRLRGGAAGASLWVACALRFGCGLMQTTLFLLPTRGDFARSQLLF